MNTATVKAYKGLGMDGVIAKWYASNTRKSLDEYQALARQVAAELAPGSRALEVAPGPGYFAIELAKLGDYRIVGLDISQTFVDIARRNAASSGVDVDFRQGNAAAMPFAAGSFDFLLCRAAFKNFAQPFEALQEMRRVLAPGGKALIMDLRRDASRDDIGKHVDTLGLSWISRLMTNLTFRFMLLKRAYTRAEFEQFFAKAKLRPAEIRESAIALDMWLEKC